MKNGFLRVAACTPNVRVADPGKNAADILTSLQEACKEKVSVLIFPELSLTGYTCGDLFFQKNLQEKAIAALFHLVEKSRDLRYFLP